VLLHLLLSSGWGLSPCFEIAVGNPWLCRRLFHALPPPLFIDAAGLFFVVFLTPSVMVIVRVKVENNLSSFSLQRFDIFLIYASICRFFSKYFSKKIRPVISNLSISVL